MTAAPRFHVNLSILFTELPLSARPAAAEAGFTEAELWWPFEGPTPADAELDALERSLADAGIALVGLNFDAGNMPGGDRGLPSRPADSDRFRANIDVAVGYSARLGCHAPPGPRRDHDRARGEHPARPGDRRGPRVRAAAAGLTRTGGVRCRPGPSSHRAPSTTCVSRPRPRGRRRATRPHPAAPVPVSRPRRRVGRRPVP